MHCILSGDPISRLSSVFFDFGGPAYIPFWGPYPSNLGVQHTIRSLSINFRGPAYSHGALYLVFERTHRHGSVSGYPIPQFWCLQLYEELSWDLTRSFEGPQLYKPLKGCHIISSQWPHTHMNHSLGALPLALGGVAYIWATLKLPQPSRGTSFSESRFDVPKYTSRGPHNSMGHSHEGLISYGYPNM